MAKSSAGDQAGRFDASMRIVVLHGPERFLIEERTRDLAGMLEERFGGVEQFVFDGNSVEPAAVLDELRSYGLMQKHKLVIVDDADVFLAGGRNAPIEEDEDGDEDGAAAADGADGSDKKSTRRPLIERYAEHPVDDATLLMRGTTWRKGNLDKAILKRGAIIACESPSEDKTIEWCIKRTAKRHDATLDADAAALLVQRIGTHLQRLDSELLKLASMTGKAGRITRALVADSTPMSREEKAWQIQSAVATGEPAAMLGKLHELVEVSRQDAVPISWAVIDLLRKEHAASHMIRQRINEGAIRNHLRLWGESIGAVMNAGRRIEPAALAQLLREAVTADQHSKSGVGEPVRNLETLMVRIADVTGR